MNDSADTPTSRSVLVSDFDGTMTGRDFYQLVRQRLVPAGTPDYWVDYRAGRLTHFDALRCFFEAAEGGPEALAALTADMNLEPDLAAKFAELDRAGWDVVVVSAGCSWYIDRLLSGAGVSPTVHTNPGRIEGDRLVMERPVDSPFLSHETGVDKAAVVRALAEGGRTVAFAGDGFPDLEPAVLVPDHLRFARGDLAEALRERGESFRPFDRWARVAEALVRGAAP